MLPLNRFNTKTKEIWQKSNSNHSDSKGGEWKVGIDKGKQPTKNNKITLSRDGDFIKKDPK